ncbi:MAG: endonuclease/exonuclease/phosphatase family protein [Vicinamibacterales bacterium]
MRLLTYNIRKGGTSRERAIAAVINAAAADLVVFQEATDPAVIERVASLCGMTQWAAKPDYSLGYAARVPIRSHIWNRPRGSRHAFLEVVLPDDTRIFGVHLSAVHAAWTEFRRVRELRALLASIKRHQHGFHVLAGDFNTVAPGDIFDKMKLPHRLRALVYLSGGQIRWRTISTILDAGYVDIYRDQHGGAISGFTFPTWAPHVRLDYVFVPTVFRERMTSCEVFMHDAAHAASDHYPLIAEWS